MKTAGKIATVTLQVWSATLALTVVAAIVFAIVQVATGNYHGTASFEF
jgi:hypothetical protein